MDKYRGSSCSDVLEGFQAIAQRCLETSCVGEVEVADSSPLTTTTTTTTNATFSGASGMEHKVLFPLFPLLLNKPCTTRLLFQSRDHMIPSFEVSWRVAVGIPFFNLLGQKSIPSPLLPTVEVHPSFQLT